MIWSQSILAKRLTEGRRDKGHREFPGFEIHYIQVIWSPAPVAAQKSLTLQTMCGSQYMEHFPVKMGYSHLEEDLRASGRHCAHFQSMPIALPW